MGQMALLPSEGRRAADFFALKTPTASIGFEPANLGTKGQYATSRPPKPLNRWLGERYGSCERQSALSPPRNRLVSALIKGPSAILALCNRVSLLHETRTNKKKTELAFVPFSVVTSVANLLFRHVCTVYYMQFWNMTQYSHRAS